HRTFRQHCLLVSLEKTLVRGEAVQARASAARYPQRRNVAIFEPELRAELAQPEAGESVLAGNRIRADVDDDVDASLEEIVEEGIHGSSFIPSRVDSWASLLGRWTETESRSGSLL